MPGINSLVSMIKSRRRRDSIILGVLVGTCTIILLTYLWNWGTVWLLFMWALTWPVMASAPLQPWWLCIWWHLCALRRKWSRCGMDHKTARGLRWCSQCFTYLWPTTLSSRRRAMIIFYSLCAVWMEEYDFLHKTSPSSLSNDGPHLVLLVFQTTLSQVSIV